MERLRKISLDTNGKTLEIHRFDTSDNTIWNTNLFVYAKRNRVKPRICIIGHKRHGKDELALHLTNICNLKQSGSSEVAMQVFLLDKMREKFGVQTVEEAMDYKNKNDEARIFMFDEICNYNLHDPSRLTKEILKVSDIYVGMRSNREMEACLSEGLFDLVIWVDASMRMPEESTSSFNISRKYADVIIDNNGSKMDLYKKAKRIGEFINTLSNERS